MPTVSCDDSARHRPIYAGHVDQGAIPVKGRLGRPRGRTRSHRGRGHGAPSMTPAEGITVRLSRLVIED